MADIDDLIAALERAEGPSLDLDHAIASIARVDDGFGVRLYTASIDAALTLVPEDWDWQVFSDDIRGTFFARLTTVDRCTRIKEQARDPAIALCIAALKARKGAA